MKESNELSIVIEKVSKWDELSEKIAEIATQTGVDGEGTWSHDQREQVFIATLTALGYAL